MKIKTLIPLISGIALSNCGTEEQIIQNVIRSLDPEHWDPTEDDNNWKNPLPLPAEETCEVCAPRDRTENQCSWYTPENETAQCADGYIRIKRAEACDDYNYGCVVDL
jgi:hypothetical protein